MKRILEPQIMDDEGWLREVLLNLDAAQVSERHLLVEGVI